MTILTFPTLPGLTYPITKGAVFYNAIQHRSVAGQTIGQSPQPYAIYSFDLPFSFLRTTAAGNRELQKLMSFFQACHGGVDPFHFSDPDDYTVTDQSLGTGDGATADFGFVRTMENVTDPIQDAIAGAVIKVAGVTQGLGSDYSILTTAQYGTNYGIRFAGGHIPTAGQAITATFTWNWLCKFTTANLDFSKFMQTIYEAGSVKLETVLQ